MSLLTDIRFLIKKYIKNPVIIIAGAYLLWRFINKHKQKTNKENFMEKVKVIEDSDKYQILYDKDLNKYILHLNGRVFSSDDLDKLKRMVK
jgi:hypothetical protein